MSDGREWKVGVFVLIGLGLLAALVILFSKGLTLTSTYPLRMKTSNSGLLMPKAAVLMAGVRVGTVGSVELAPDGKAVIIGLNIFPRYKIHSDARFVIDQIGFLGDQFVSIVPRENRAGLLQSGEEVQCEEPFNLQEVARSAMGLIQRVDQTAKRLNDAVTRVDQQLLSAQTLTNLTATISNFRLVSERALSAVAGFDNVVQSNVPPVSLAVSNLVSFSTAMDKVASDLDELVTTNRAHFSSAVKNVETATASVNSLLDDLRHGKGLAGFLLKDEETKAQVSQTMNNLTTLSSNLNRFGLLYKPKPVKSPSTNAASIYTGRKP